MYLKFLQKPRCPGWFKTTQALWSAVKKTSLNSSKDNFIGKSSRLSTKGKLSILLNFLFPFVYFIGVFSILKYKTSVLKTTTWWMRAWHFVDGWMILETFRFEDEDDYFRVFSKSIDFLQSLFHHISLGKLALLSLIKEVMRFPDRKMIKLLAFDILFSRAKTRSRMTLEHHVVLRKSRTRTRNRNRLRI